MGIDISGEPGAADLVVDALIGYSLKGDPKGRTAELIIWANREAAPVLALDTPSGLDVTTGDPADPCVRAEATMTLALPKVGLVGAPHVGELYLADVSVPPFVYRRFDIDVPPLFSAGRAGRVDRLGLPSPIRLTHGVRPSPRRASRPLAHRADGTREGRTGLPG
jgi:hypothetical protein